MRQLADIFFGLHELKVRRVYKQGIKSNHNPGGLHGSDVNYSFLLSDLLIKPALFVIIHVT